MADYELVCEMPKCKARIAELETLANEALNRLEESIDNTPDSRFTDRTRAWLEAVRKAMEKE